jgi:hypothetical protein
MKFTFMALPLVVAACTHAPPHSEQKDGRTIVKGLSRHALLAVQEKEPGCVSWQLKNDGLQQGVAGRVHIVVGANGKASCTFENVAGDAQTVVKEAVAKCEFLPLEEAENGNRLFSILSFDLPLDHPLRADEKMMLIAR